MTGTSHGRGRFVSLLGAMVLLGVGAFLVMRAAGFGTRVGPVAAALAVPGLMFVAASAPAGLAT